MNSSNSGSRKSSRYAGSSSKGICIALSSITSNSILLLSATSSLLNPKAKSTGMMPLKKVNGGLNQGLSLAGKNLSGSSSSESCSSGGPSNSIELLESSTLSDNSSGSL